MAEAPSSALEEGVIKSRLHWLLIKNLPFALDDGDLLNLATDRLSHGVVSALQFAYVIKDARTGRSKGSGFLGFGSSRNVAEEAAKMLHGTTLSKRALEAEVTVDRHYGRHYSSGTFSSHTQALGEGTRPSNSTPIAMTPQITLQDCIQAMKSAHKSMKQILEKIQKLPHHQSGGGGDTNDHVKQRKLMPGLLPKKKIKAATSTYVRASEVLQKYISPSSPQRKSTISKAEEDGREVKLSVSDTVARCCCDAIFVASEVLRQLLRFGGKKWDGLEEEEEKEKEKEKEGKREEEGIAIGSSTNDSIEDRAAGAIATAPVSLNTKKQQLQAAQSSSSSSPPPPSLLSSSFLSRQQLSWPRHGPEPAKSMSTAAADHLTIYQSLKRQLDCMYEVLEVWGKAGNDEVLAMKEEHTDDVMEAELQDNASITKQMICRAINQYEDFEDYLARAMIMEEHGYNLPATRSSSSSRHQDELRSSCAKSTTKDAIIFWNAVKLSEAGCDLRKGVVLHIQRHVDALSDGTARCCPFGSFATGLSKDSSDIDILILTPSMVAKSGGGEEERRPLGQPELLQPPSSSLSVSPFPVTPMFFLPKLARSLREEEDEEGGGGGRGGRKRILKKVETLLTPRVPIVRVAFDGAALAATLLAKDTRGTGERRRPRTVVEEEEKKKNKKESIVTAPNSRGRNISNNISSSGSSVAISSNGSSSSSSNSSSSKSSGTSNSVSGSSRGREILCEVSLQDAKNLRKAAIIRKMLDRHALARPMINIVREWASSRGISAASSSSSSLLSSSAREKKHHSSPSSSSSPLPHHRHQQRHLNLISSLNSFAITILVLAFLQNRRQLRMRRKKEKEELPHQNANVASTGKPISAESLYPPSPRATIDLYGFFRFYGCVGSREFAKRIRLALDDENEDEEQQKKKEEEDENQEERRDDEDKEKDHFDAEGMETENKGEMEEEDEKRNEINAGVMGSGTAVASSSKSRTEKEEEMRPQGRRSSTPQFPPSLNNTNLSSSSTVPPLHIVDPVDSEDNPARNITMAMKRRIRREMIRASLLLHNGRSLSEVCSRNSSYKYINDGTKHNLAHSQNKRRNKKKKKKKKKTKRSGNGGKNSSMNGAGGPQIKKRRTKSEQNK